MTREIHSKIISFEDYKGAINKLDDMAQFDPAKITINFPKSESRSAKDFFNNFFEIADGNPEWNV